MSPFPFVKMIPGVGHAVIIVVMMTAMAMAISFAHACHVYVSRIEKEVFSTPAHHSCHTEVGLIPVSFSSSSNTPHHL